MKRIFITSIGFIIGLLLSASVYSATFIEFDSFPITGETSAPASGGGWNYSVVPGSGFAKWTKSTGYLEASGIHDYFYKYSASYNTLHMGFEHFGYFQITNSKSMGGNSLEYVITGGVNTTTCPDPSSNCSASGLELHNKQKYLEAISS